MFGCFGSIAERLPLWNLSGLGCVTFSVYGLGLVSSPLGVPKVSLRHPARDGFLLRLSPDLGGVWLFWIHRREVAALGLSGLGCVTFSVYVLGLVSSPLGVPKVSLRHPAKDGFLLRLSPDLGGVWLFWIHRREVAALGLSGLGCVTFSVYGLGLVSSPLGVPKVSLRHPAKDGFLLRLSPDLGGVKLFWIHRREVAALGLSGLGCVTFSVYGFFSFRGSKGFILGTLSLQGCLRNLLPRRAVRDNFGNRNFWQCLRTTQRLARSVGRPKLRHVRCVSGLSLELASARLRRESLGCGNFRETRAPRSVSLATRVAKNCGTFGFIRGLLLEPSSSKVGLWNLLPPRLRRETFGNEKFGEALALRSVLIATREAQSCGKLVGFAACLRDLLSPTWAAKNFAYRNF